MVSRSPARTLLTKVAVMYLHLRSAGRLLAILAFFGALQSSTTFAGQEAAEAPAQAATITVENTGAYPLKYFIPGFDTKGVSENWPTSYHSYGYKLRSNNPSETTPIAYAFQDI